MESLLVKYGYALLFGGVALEGEAVLLTAGLLAQRGLFRLPVVIAIAVAANAVADQVYFQLARQRGRAWLERRFGQRPHYQKLIDLVGRRGFLMLVVSRFAYGLRIAIPAACGALGMRVLTFTLVDLLAGVLWAIPMGLLGYFAGNAVEPLLEGVRRYEEGAALVLVVGVAAWFGLRRARRAVRWRELRVADALALFHALVPFLIGLMGALNLLSAIWPREHAVVRELERWLPLEVMQRSRALMLLAGVALLQVTRNLTRRKALAWWVATIALAVSLVSHLGRAFDLHHSMVAALLLAYLLVYRRRFEARSDPASLRQALIMAPVLAAVVFVYGNVSLHNMARHYRWDPGNGPAAEAVRSGLLIVEPGVEPLSPHAARVLGSLQIAGWLSRFYLLVLVLRPVVLRRRQQAPPALVGRSVRDYGTHSLSAFAVLDDKHHLAVAGGRGLLAYAVRGDVAFALGDPLCAAEDADLAIADFVSHCRRHGWTPCFYEVSEEWLPAFRRASLRSLKMAEEAIVELASFDLRGGRRSALRSMVHKVTRLGLAVRRYDRTLGADASIEEQLEEISEEWLAGKRIGELGFTVSRFSLEALAAAFVFLCTRGEQVVAFTSWRPYRAGQAAVLDLMRKRTDAPSGTMDLLVSRSLEELRGLGLEQASLANAPLANVGEPRRGLEKGVALLFENLNAFYGYKNLFQFKKKFDPRWEGRHLVYPGGPALPAIAVALVLITLVALVLFLDEPHVLPRTADTVNLAPSMLPLYAFYSLLRMLAAYLLSLTFAIATGYWAASSSAGRRVILPVLDVLQAVPILGFFPAAIFFFVRLFHGSAFGVEVAAVFLIFTSQAWNLAFSVYESLTTIPEDVRTAVTVSRASGVVLWRRLLLPACVPRLVYNSMLSWAGGWYFLIASEVIAVGKRTFVLPGLGSYIGESIMAGRQPLAGAGLLALVLVIVGLHLFLWSPLESWARRFRYETTSGEALRPPFVQRLLRRTPLVRGAIRQAARAGGRVIGRSAPVLSHAVAGPWLRPALVLAGLALLALLVWGGVLTARVLLRPLPPQAAAIPSALGASFVRLLVAYAISLVWTIPLAAWVSRSALRAERLVPVAQVLASLPATAFFPVIVAIVLRFRLGMNVAAVALVLTGMQWYLLFNLIAAAQAMPEDMRELARSTGARGLFYLRRFFVPAALPSLITGSLTAWGGGWNALVLSESVTAAGRTWSVHGIGALLDRATYVDGDLQLITLVIVSMVATVLVLNRALWRPLYAWAALRYRLDV